MVNTSFSKPTLAQLISQAESNMNRIDGADARLRNSVLNVLARVTAGMSHLQHNYLDWIARQAFISTCDAENLDAHGFGTYKILRVAASKASGNVTFVGTNGAVIPAQTELQRGDGAVYITTADATISGGSAVTNVEAQDAGTAGNAIAATSLTLIAPISGVNSTATVTTGITGGFDDEGDDSYRARILQRIQSPPHGGAESDYEQWALSVAGVTRAWISPNEPSRGAVTVRFVADNNTTPTPQNLAVQSEAMDNASWLKTSVTVTPGGAIHPDTSATFTLTPGAANSVFRELIPIFETGTFKFEMDCYGLGGARTFDMKILAADGTTVLGTATVVAPSGGWATLSVTATVSGGSSIYAQIGGASSFATGENIVVTKAHVYQDSHSAEYVKTTTDQIVGSLIIPSSDLVQDVFDYITDPSVAPVTADVVIVAPIAKRLDITITGLNPNTAAVRAAVLAELEDMLRRDSAPGGTIRQSRIWEAVSIATGESYHTITSPSSDQTAGTGRIFVLGTVTFA